MVVSSFSGTELELLEILNGVATGFSIIGELFMISCFLMFENLQSFPMKLVISLTVADLGFSVSNIISYFQSSSTVCILEGFIRVTSVWSGGIWIAFIMWVSYRQINSFDYTLLKSYKKFLLVNFIVSLFPGLFSLLMSYENSDYGYTDLFWYCTISSSIEENLIFLIPFWSFLGLSIYYLYKVYDLTKKRLTNPDQIEYKEVIIYPLILIVLWLPDLLNRLTSYINGNPYIVIVVINVAVTRLQGFANAIIFGRQYIKTIKARIISNELESHIMSKNNTEVE